MAAVVGSKECGGGLPSYNDHSGGGGGGDGTGGFDQRHVVVVEGMNVKVGYVYPSSHMTVNPK